MENVKQDQEQTTKTSANGEYHKRIEAFVNRKEPLTTEEKDKNFKVMETVSDLIEKDFSCTDNGKNVIFCVASTERDDKDGTSGVQDAVLLKGSQMGIITALITAAKQSKEVSRAIQVASEYLSLSPAELAMMKAFGMMGKFKG